METQVPDSRTRQVDELLNRHSGGQDTRKARKRRLIFQLAYFAGRAMNRLIELVIVLPVVLLLTIPCGFFLLIRKMVSGRKVFALQDIVGRNGARITIYPFDSRNRFIATLPLFCQVITGQLALTGTVLTDWEDRRSGLEQGYIRSIKPGIFSLWYVRQASKIAHEGHDAIEWEYVFRKNLFFDFFLLLRTIPAFFYQSDTPGNNDILSLFGLDIANMTMREAIELLEQSIRADKSTAVFYVNPDCLNKIFSDQEYFRILKQGDLVLPDGIGLTIAGNMLQTPLKENVNGTDMLPFLCEMAAREDYSLFLLGGRPGVADTMAEKLQTTYGVTVAGTAHGYFDRETENEQICRRINASGARILLVAFGAPLQEKWIHANRAQLQANVLMGVGGLFDFYSGKTRRAPRWLREIGLEWLYRMLQEPGRMWRRYVIGNPLFLYRVTKWKLYSAAPVAEKNS
jgi:N-acetylglucosaminyldiphosphoundecaprenol N-acetyl-beta-D-mannosaminyltransferase